MERSAQAGIAYGDRCLQDLNNDGTDLKNSFVSVLLID